MCISPFKKSQNSVDENKQQCPREFQRMSKKGKKPRKILERTKQLKRKTEIY